MRHDLHRLRWPNGRRPCRARLRERERLLPCARYRLQEMPSDDYDQRTEWNKLYVTNEIYRIGRSCVSSLVTGVPKKHLIYAMSANPS